MKDRYTVITIQNSMDMSTPRVLLAFSAPSFIASLREARSLVKGDKAHKVREVQIFASKDNFRYAPDDYKGKNSPLVFTITKARDEEGAANLWKEQFFGAKDPVALQELPESEAKRASPKKFRLVLVKTEKVRDRPYTKFFQVGEELDCEQEAVDLIYPMVCDHDLIIYDDKGNVRHHAEAVSQARE